MTKQLLLRAACLLALAAASACAKADASNLVPDGPPLAMPVPPPRVIAPVEELAVVPDPPEPEPPPVTAKTPPPPRATGKPEAKADPAPVAAQPAPPPATPPAPREVRAVPTAAAAGEERKVRDVLDRASRDLARVDYQRLTTEGRTQYEQSKSFSAEAEEALKERNFVYAMTLADKAANLAAQLVGR
jgi:hypothetical protein